MKKKSNTAWHGRPIRTVRYFHHVVLEAHQQILEIRGPWADPRAHPAVMPAIDVTARLAALAAQLPPGLPHRKRWSRQLVELDGERSVHSGRSPREGAQKIFAVVLPQRGNIQ